MGLQSPALMASALVYFIQVSRENAGMRLLFVSQIKPTFRKPGRGGMNEEERHVLSNQRGSREKELTGMFP